MTNPTDEIVPQQKNIEIFLIEPNNRQSYQIIKNDPKVFEEVIGGHFRVLTVWDLKDRGIVLVVDEEGALKQSPRSLFTNEYGWIFGTCFLVKISGNDFANFNPQDRALIKRWMMG